MKSPDVRPKVVMLVAGGIATDARVRKTAQSVQSLGYDVTLLYGLRDITEPQRGRIGSVRTIGLPLPRDLARAKGRLDKERDRARRRTFPGFSSPAAYEWAYHQNRLAGLKASAYPRPVRALLRIPRAIFRWREKYYLRGEGPLRSRSGSDHRKVNWEAEVPTFSDLSLTFTKEIWRRSPDIIHAHDAHVLMAAVHAKRHLRARGKSPALIYDAHEFVAGSVRRTHRLEQAWTAMERHYIRDVDAVITVSESIADALQTQHRLKDRPTVVLNAPAVADAALAPSDVRTDCGLDERTPLLVYTGTTMPRRGVSTAIDALTLLPDVHLAIVCVPNVAHKFSQMLAQHAEDAGVADRVHLLEPVRPEEVLDYIRTADLGVHPMIGQIPNHEMALPNKLFDYVLAGLPVVVSDLREMGAFVRQTGVGEPFTFGDPLDCARAVKMVLSAAEDYRSRIREADLRQSHAWEGQTSQLQSAYTSLRPVGRPALARAAHTLPATP